MREDNASDKLSFKAFQIRSSNCVCALTRLHSPQKNKHHQLLPIISQVAVFFFSSTCYVIPVDFFFPLIFLAVVFEDSLILV